MLIVTLTFTILCRLFYGQIRQTFIETLKGVPTTHQKTDLFSHLPVNVGTDAEQGEFGFDIYDGLGRYFDDTIEYEGQRVSMEVGLVKVPPLLQVQLQVRYPVMRRRRSLTEDDIFDRECNSIASSCSRGNRRRMSSLARRCIWIGSWTARIRIRGSVRRLYRMNSMDVGNA